MDYISHPPLPLPSSKASTDIGRIAIPRNQKRFCESHSGTEAIQPTILRALVATNSLKAQGPFANGHQIQICKIIVVISYQFWCNAGRSTEVVIWTSLIIGVWRPRTGQSYLLAILYPIEPSAISPALPW